MKRKWLAMALTAGLANSAALYWLTHSLPDLEHPLKSVNAFALSDGGSLTVEIEDAAGSQFYFGIMADLARISHEAGRRGR